MYLSWVIILWPSLKEQPPLFWWERLKAEGKNNKNENCLTSLEALSLKVSMSLLLTFCWSRQITWASPVWTGREVHSSHREDSDDLRIMIHIGRCHVQFIYFPCLILFYSGLYENAFVSPTTFKRSSVEEKFSQTHHWLGIFAALWCYQHRHYGLSADSICIRGLFHHLLSPFLLLLRIIFQQSVLCCA